MTEEYQGQIPVDDLPVDAPPLDESAVYNVEFKKFTVSPKPSKKGVIFGGLQVEVIDGDFEGATLTNNYVPLPVFIDENASKADKYRLGRQNETFARIVRCFKIKGSAPSVSFSRPESLKAFEEWISQFYGNQGQVTIKNQEFPENSGRLRPNVNDFVY